MAVRCSPRLSCVKRIAVHRLRLIGGRIDAGL